MSLYIYPRLDDATAARLRDHLLGMRPSEASSQWALTHPSQYFAAVGSRVEPNHLVAVRASVLEHVRELLATADRRRLSLEERRDLDRMVGAALHDSMGIVPSDASHVGVWSFLSLVLLPEIPLARFPDLPLERALGRPRNALRRVWWREEVLGSLVDDIEGPLAPLGEDELVQLMERTGLSSNRRVLAQLLPLVLARPAGPNDGRPDFVRLLAKLTLAEMAHTETDIFGDGELAEWASSLAERTELRWMAS